MSIWESIEDTVKGAGDAISDGFKGITNLGDAILDGIDKVFDEAGNLVDEIGEAVFGTETIYTVGCTATKLINETPDYLQAGILESALHNKSFPNAIVRSNMYTYATQARNFYTYGKNHFVNGTPEGTLKNVEQDTAALQLVLDGIEGSVVNIQQVRLSSPQARFWAYEYMTANMGWNKDDNLILTHDVTDNLGSPITEDLYYYSAEFTRYLPNQLRIYFYYEVAGVPSLAYKNYFITPPDYTELYYQAWYNNPLATPSEINPNYTPTQISDEVASIYATYTTVGPETMEETVDMDAADTDIINWCIAETIYPLQLAYALGDVEQDWIDRAVTLGIPGFVAEVITVESKFFIYNVSDGTYPTLDISEDASYFSPFFPVIPIMQDKVWVNSDTNSDLYITGNKTLKKLSLNIDDISDGINNEADNPNLDNTNDAFVTMAIQVTTNVDQSIDYLGRFFAKLQETSKYTQTDWDNWLALPESSKVVGAAPINYLLISESEFNMTLTYNYITSALITGSIGEVGAGGRYIEVLPDLTYGGYESGDGATVSSFSLNNSYMMLRTQVTPTQYREIKIHGLQHITNVGNRESFKVTLGMSQTTDFDKSFYIPVSLDILNEFRPYDKNIISCESIVLVIYAIEKTDLEWYETALFAAVLQIATIIIAAITLQPQLIAIAGAATIYAAAYLIAELIVYSYLVTLTLDLVLEAIGVEYGLILALITAVAAAYAGTTSTPIVAYMPTAADLLMLSTQLSAATNRLVKKDLIGIQEDVQELYESYSDRLEEIEDINDGLLESNDALIEIIRGDLIIDPNETPDMFYTRTIHGGNIGVKSVEVIANYVDVALTLPKYKDYTI